MRVYVLFHGRVDIMSALWQDDHDEIGAPTRVRCTSRTCSAKLVSNSALSILPCNKRRFFDLNT